jgi:hypothetical protein
MPAFVPPPELNLNGTNYQDNIINSDDLVSPNVQICPNQNEKSFTQRKLSSSPLSSPSPIRMVEEVKEEFSDVDGPTPQEVLDEQLPSLLPIQQEAPRYFTRSKHQISISSADDDN